MLRKESDMHPWFEIYSGKHFRWTAIDPATIEPIDIIHSLSQQCRYLGHSARFYSIAEHTCHVTELLPNLLKPFGIVHDWSEAYTGDLPKPLKLILPDYQEIEQTVQNAIHYKFVGRVPTVEEHHEIKKADHMTLKAEVLVLSHSKGYNWGSWFEDIPVPETEIHCWTCEEAERQLFELWSKVGV